MDFNKVLRELRISRKLTQKQLAAKSRIALGTIQAIEHGKHLPYKYTIDQLAKVLGVPMAEMFLIALSDEYLSENVRKKTDELIEALKNEQCVEA